MNADFQPLAYGIKQSIKIRLQERVKRRKQKFISQIMTSKTPVRSAEDIDEVALSYAEIKALATGNPFIKEKMDLDVEVARLKMLKANYLSQKYELEDMLIKVFPQHIKSVEQRAAGYRADIETIEANTPAQKEWLPMTICDITYTEKTDAGKAIIEACKRMTSPDLVQIGSYRGFDMELSFDVFSKEYRITLIGKMRHMVSLGTDIHGNITRLDNVLDGLYPHLLSCMDELENIRKQMENAKEDVQKPFMQEEALQAKSKRLNELNIMLNLDEKDHELIDVEPEEGENEPVVVPKLER